MFGKQMVRTMIERSAENDNDRRNFLRTAGVAGLGVVGATALSGLDAGSALAGSAPSDGAILNFALNLEYLEAEFYSHAAFGHGLAHQFTTGKGRHGGVIGGRAVKWQTPNIRKYATEIAHDEVSHVKFLRAALGSARVARPEIDLQHSFTAAARAAGLIGAHQTFDPYANEDNFLLAAFLFEDVGVTAYKGAAPLIHNKAYLEAAAGILAVEAYHAGIVRTNLYAKGLDKPVAAISAARDSLDGRSDDDQGIGGKRRANLVPTDANGIAFSRTAPQVLNIVYLTPKKATKGGFYPEGVNGVINTSGS
jgi:hypothetical protein